MPDTAEGARVQLDTIRNNEPPLTRAAALDRVRELLHGPHAKGLLAGTDGFKLRWELDSAICDYGHAAAMEATLALAAALSAEFAKPAEAA